MDESNRGLAFSSFYQMAASMTRDGRYVAFVGRTLQWPSASRLYVWDTQMVTLIPVHAANRSGSQAFQCLNNHRQLAVGWITYAADNADRLPSTRPVAGIMSWVPLRITLMRGCWSIRA